MIILLKENLITLWRNMKEARVQNPQHNVYNIQDTAHIFLTFKELRGCRRKK